MSFTLCTPDRAEQKMFAAHLRYPMTHKSALENLLSMEINHVMLKVLDNIIIMLQFMEFIAFKNICIEIYYMFCILKMCEHKKNL